MPLLFELLPPPLPLLLLLLFESLIIIYSIIMFSIIAKVVHFIVLVSFVFLFQLMDMASIALYIYNMYNTRPMSLYIGMHSLHHLDIVCVYIRSLLLFRSFISLSFSRAQNLNLLLLLSVIVFCAFEWFET